VQVAARQVGGQCAVGQGWHLLLDIDKASAGLGQQRHQLSLRHGKVAGKHTGNLCRVGGRERWIGCYSDGRLRCGKDQTIAIGDLAARREQRQCPSQRIECVGRGVETLELQQPPGTQRQGHGNHDQQCMQPAMRRGERQAKRRLAPNRPDLGLLNSGFGLS
jgi:hypothetical protein